MAAISTFCILVVSFAGIACAQTDYDLLIKGGHVIDGKNKISAVRDVAIKDGKIAAVAPNLAASRALKTVDASGLYVTPGLIDIHVHVYPGLTRGSYANGSLGLQPDGFTLRNGVTTVADAGSAGWRTFEDFKTRIIDTQKTRVLSFLNIVGAGMGSGPIEQNLEDMEVKPTADMALKYKGVIVGIKSAHFNGPEWTPYINAEEVGKIAHIPVMVDFGGNVRAGRTLYDLLNKYFRPGDIFTHMYGGRRGEQDPETKGPSKAMIDGRKRGVIFDVGHGGGSFLWSCAIPLMKAGFIPDSISTDLHYRQHERRNEGHAQRDGQVPGHGHVAGRSDSPFHVEPGEGDSARRPGQPLGRVAGRCGGAAAGKGQVRIRGPDRGTFRRHGETALRNDPARRQGGL